MFTLLMTGLLAAVQPPVTPAPANLGTAQELARLRSQLPRARKAAELLNPRELADAMDYPVEALRNDQQGTVQTWVLVSAEGRAERCGIEKSSGFPVLDSQTCDLITANARFRPAKDPRGRPVRGLFHQSLTWRLEEGGHKPAMMANSISRETFTVGPGGTVRECTSQVRLPTSGWIDVPETKCRIFAEQAAPLLAAARAQSKLHDARVTFEARAFADPALPLPPLADEPGDRLIYLRQVVMSFDSAGNRTRCETVESTGAFDFKPNACTDATFTSFGKSLAEAGVKTDQIRLQWAVILKDEPK